MKGLAYLRAKEDGAFAIMFVAVLIVLIGFVGMAIDVGPMYNRKVELNNMAEAVALAAARELDGSAAGIGNARNAAQTAAQRMSYQGNIAFQWNDAALSFSNSPARSGTWSSVASAQGNPQGLFYVKVDTSGLDAAAGEVHPVFMPILSSALGTVAVGDSVVAGRTSINVTPIAVCAMSPDAVSERTVTGLASTELVQYGFRRGVSYDLMQLNPSGQTPARYLVNPVVAPGVFSSVFDTSLIGQFVCTGSMWVPSLAGGSMRVSPLPASSPLSALATQLNSRFDDYSGGLCSPNGAPPDYNVKQYAYDKVNGAAWMNPGTGRAAALATTSRNKLETIADLPDPPAGTAAGDYGPLWANAKAAKYAATEPAGGYATFATSDWAKLYKSGPSAVSYPSGSLTPYQASNGINYVKPNPSRLEISTDQRRILNIPLLSCPVPAGANVQASVLGIGKFFMTVPATSDKLIAEFAGLAPSKSLTGNVELYP
jgi:Flp pilus assembly protein TadG